MDLINRHRSSPDDTELFQTGPGRFRENTNGSGNDRYSENGFSDEDETLNTPKTDEENTTKSISSPISFQFTDQGTYTTPKSNGERAEDGHDIATSPLSLDQILLSKSEAETSYLNEEEISESVLRLSEDPIPIIKVAASVDELKSMSEESWEEEDTSAEWDFVLPVLTPPARLQPGIGEGQEGFSLLDLLGAMQDGVTLQGIQSYLGYYDNATIRRHINGTVLGFPAMLFVVATNNDWILRTWVGYGGDVTAVHEASQVPLLAFAIMHAETIQTETTQVVATLLSLGASAQVIPSAFYTPFCHDLPDKGPELASLEDLSDENKQWCTEVAREKLARTMNITQRYYLERATKTKKPSVRHRQVALLRNAESLLGIPYFLIGQTTAANLLLQNLLSYIMIPTRKPLVLVFAGPSGHGKTELARRLGYLMSLELEVVDCTIHNHEMELFGPRKPFVGSEPGSPLNNFLAKHDGKRCVVFLDEFEKTTKDIHQALLLPFDNGMFPI